MSASPDNSGLVEFVDPSAGDRGADEQSSLLKTVTIGRRLEPLLQVGQDAGSSTSSETSGGILPTTPRLWWGKMIIQALLWCKALRQVY